MLRTSKYDLWRESTRIHFVSNSFKVFLMYLCPISCNDFIAQKVLVEISFATVIVSIVLCVHLYVRDWAEEGGAEETQRLQVAVQEIRESSLEVGVAAA